MSTSSTLERSQLFASLFEQVSAAIGTASVPDRLAAFSAFASAGFPTHKDEEWKYVPMRDISESTWHLPQNGNAPLNSEIAQLNLGGLKVVFVNGYLDESQSDLTLRNGLSFTHLTTDNPGAVGELSHFNDKLGSTNDDRFVQLNAALWTEGVALHISADYDESEPVHIVYLTTSNEERAIISPRIVVRVAENAGIKLVEQYAGSGSHFTNSVTEVHVEANARVEHIRIQDDAKSAVNFGNSFVRQQSGSTYRSASVQFGSKTGRNEINVDIQGEHTETWLDGTYVGNGSQVLSNFTRLDHAKPNCHSFEVYKGILDQEASGSFNGKIFVYEDAQKTDAKQTNQALLLAPTATINSKPQLEIFADDVKCTHGATIGQLREDALFYLQSRGIPISEAKKLLVYAFSAEVLERVSIEPLRTALESRLFHKLNPES